MPRTTPLPAGNEPFVSGKHLEFVDTFVARCATAYACLVIRSFRHKGLRRFFDSGSTAGIQADHARRLRMLLSALHSAQVIADMDIPGFRLHPLKGSAKGRWSVWVNGNWRLTFEFIDGHAHVVDYEDYH